MKLGTALCLAAALAVLSACDRNDSKPRQATASESAARPSALDIAAAIFGPDPAVKAAEQAAGIAARRLADAQATKAQPRHPAQKSDGMAAPTAQARKLESTLAAPPLPAPVAPVRSLPKPAEATTASTERTVAGPFAKSASATPDAATQATSAAPGPEGDTALPADTAGAKVSVAPAAAPSPPPAPKPKKPIVAPDFFHADTDFDARISYDEAKAIWPDLTRQQFDAADTNGSGSLSADEYAALVAHPPQ